MSIPDKVREKMRQRLWLLADEVCWMSLSAAQKTKHYEEWTRAPDIGGVLSRYIDAKQVRVYLKDTILKEYAQDRMGDAVRPFRVLGIPATEETSEVYVKPHGRRFKDGRVICWGRAEDWKSILMALHERTYATERVRPFGAVLFQSVGRYHEEHMREMVKDAATRLGVEKLIWLEN